MKNYNNFMKNPPPNAKGDIYSLRTTKKDKYIKENVKYNSRGNIINESVEDEVLIKGLPVNKKVKYDDTLMTRAIKYGLVILINYSGDKDNWKGGRERVIYPMALGVNRNTRNTLLRGWHLTGWSVSKRRNVEKEWRLFNVENIKSMMFTGDFYRMAPRGYKMNDRAMTEKVIKTADFNEIRINQEKLVKSGKLEVDNKNEIGKKDSPIVTKIDARTTDTEMDLRNMFDNEYVSDYRNRLEDLKFTFLKKIGQNEHLVIMGAIGTVNRTVKLYDGKEFIGNYKVRKSAKGRDIKTIKNVDGRKTFPLYTFNQVVD